MRLSPMIKDRPADRGTPTVDRNVGWYRKIFFDVLPTRTKNRSRSMRRKTYRQIRARSSAAHHHNVYVVLLLPEVAELREIAAANRGRDPKKPCVYVGMTGLAPEERFENHKKGVKAAKVVQLYGVRLMPELYEVYNPMPFDAAVVMERELAEDLRRQGYTVTGGC